METTLTAAERARLQTAMKQAASVRLYRRLQAVFLAGEGHSATQVAAITGSSARSVQYWCATWRRSGERRRPQRALAEQPRLGRHPLLPALDRTRLLAELAQDPLALGYAATNSDGAVVGRAPASPRLADHRTHVAPPPARGGPALEAAAFCLRRTRPSRRPEKRALTRAMKRLPAGGRLLVLDETTLRHRPPLRAARALRGQQAAVRISGQNARRCLFGTVDLRTGRRVLLVTARQRLADFHRFLRKRRHGVGGCGTLWLLLDRHSSHGSPSSLRLAEKLGIRLFWLPRQHPKLNPVDHLWRGLKNPLAANRQFASVDELAAYAESWMRALTPVQTLRKASLLSPNCWLRKLRKTLWPST